MPHRYAIAVLAFGLLGCAQSDDDKSADGDGADDVADSGETTAGDSGEAATVNYWRDIKPLLDGRCATCHLADGVAPFPLTSYADALAYGPSAVPSVMERTMPPWPPNDECAEHVGNRSLTDPQIDLLMEWVDLGMPEGDPAEEGAPMEPSSAGISRVDLTLPMPEAYRVTQTPDDYRCFLVPWPEEFTSTKYVTAFNAVPGNDKIVHHVIAFLAGPDDVAEYQQLDADEDGPGYTCFGGSGGPSRGWLGAWAPGSNGRDLPDGLGMAVEPGSMIVLQVHYNALTEDEAPDLSSIEVKLEDSVDKEAFILPFTNPQWFLGGMTIPAGESAVTHEFSADLAGYGGSALTIYSASLHMHLLGRNAKLSLTRAGGDDDCLLQIDDWDFSWQGSYGWPQPRTVAAGDLLTLSCTFDNSVENQPTIGGVQAEPRTVNWGEGTTDEMCLGVVLATRD